MSNTLRNMPAPALVATRTAARVTEAQWRLDNWNMAPKNITRLSAYVANTPAQAPAVKAARKAAPAKAAPAKPAPVAKAGKVTTGGLSSKAVGALVEMALGEEAFGPKGGMTPAARKLYGQVARGEITAAQIVADSLANA